MILNDENDPTELQVNIPVIHYETGQATTQFSKGMKMIGNDGSTL